MNLKNKIISKFIKEGHTYEYEYGEIHEGLIKDHELTADQQRLYSYYVPIVIDSQIAYIKFKIKIKIKIKKTKQNVVAHILFEIIKKTKLNNYL